MSGQQVRTKRQKPPTAKWKTFSRTAISGAIILLVATAILTIVSLKQNFAFLAPGTNISTGQKGNLIRVPAGGNLQEAVNKASSGDIIELQAGATYKGELKLPVKPLTDYVTIQTSAFKQLPEGRQVSPLDARLMAKIVSPGKGISAVSAERGAHHYRFVGIEFAPGNSDYVYNLVLFGSEENTPEVPHHLEIDRSYLHPFKTGVTRRGLALNSAETTIKNSYFEGFAFEGEETQGICGWTGSKNVKIINNHIEGGAENIMFGGGDPKTSDLIPSDIEIRGNLLTKPEKWRGTVTNKTLFELKNAKRVQFTGNFLENNFVGSAFRITVRNQDGAAAFSTIENVLIKDNIIRGAGEAINILGKDDTFPSRTLKDLQITNNLWLDIGAAGFDGSGYFVQINNGENVEVSHNTVFQTGNVISAYGAPTKNFVFRDNILAYNEYGVHVSEFADARITPENYFPAIVKNNVVVNNRNISANDYYFPANNYQLSNFKQIGFTGLSRKNFNLSAVSPYKGKGNAKSDVGADIESIKKAMPPNLFARLFK